MRDVRQRLIESDPPATALVIDAEGVSDIDTTAVQQLRELVEDLEAAQVAVTFARVRGPVSDMFERAGIMDLVGEDAIYLEVDDAVEHYLAGTSATEPRPSDRISDDDEEDQP